MHKSKFFYRFGAKTKIMKLQDAAKINPNAMLVHSKVLFDVFHPNSEHIEINDIAHALSNICRYGGHSPKFYSVGQHSVLCSLVPGTYQEQMEALMHDSSEAYLADMPRPIKRNLPEYIRVENNLLEVIFKRFGLTFPLTPRVHKVDNDMLEFEYVSFFDDKDSNPDFDFWVPEKAKAAFLDRYNELKLKIESEKEITA